MARVTKEIADAHRRELIDAAGRLFRENGLDGVGVAEISRAANLTHGALYSGFSSKRELAVAALNAGWEASQNRMMVAIGSEPNLSAILDFYVSGRHRDDRVRCCPMVAAASEAARQDSDYRHAFREAFTEFAVTLRAAIEREHGADAYRKALTCAAAMVGSVAIARSFDEQASNELLEAVRTSLAELAADRGTSHTRKSPKTTKEEKPTAVSNPAQREPSGGKKSGRSASAGGSSPPRR